MMIKEGFEILILAGHSEGKQNKRKKGCNLLNKLVQRDGRTRTGKDSEKAKIAKSFRA